MKNSLKLLFINDSQGEVSAIVQVFQAGGYIVDHLRVASLEGVKEGLTDHQWDAVFSKPVLNDFNAVDALRIYKECGVSMPFVVISDDDGHRMATSVMEAGATVFIEKGKLNLLLGIVEQALQTLEIKLSKEKTEEDLKKSEEMYRTIFEYSGIALALADEDATLVMVNEAFSDSLGYTKDELEGKMSWTQFVAPELLNDLLALSRRIREEPQQGPSTYELVYINRSGERREAFVTSTVLVETKQSLISLLDITKQKNIDAERFALNRASRAVIEGGDFHQIAAQIFDICRDLTAANVGCIGILDEKKDEYKLVSFDVGGVDVNVDSIVTMPARQLRIIARRSGSGFYENAFSETAWQKMISIGHLDLKNILFSPLLIDGEPLGLIGLANKETDFTDQDLQFVKSLSEICTIALINDRNLERLKTSEETFRMAMDVTYDGLWDWDVKNSRIYFSPSWARIIGEESVPQELTTWRDLIHPEDKKEALKSVVQHLKGENEQYHSMHRLLTKNGTYKWILGRGKVVSRDAAGRALRMIGTITDISDRKKVEEELVKEKTRVEKIVNTAKTIILTLDKQARIIDFNPYMEELSGYSIDEVRGRDWITLFIPERYRDKIRKLHETAIQGYNPTRGNINPIVTKGGNERQIEWYDTVIEDEKGGESFLLATGQDVTDHIRTIYALRESEEKFSKIFYSHPNPMLIVSPGSGIINDVNNAFLQFAKRSRIESIGKRMTDLRLWASEVDRSHFIELLTTQDRIQGFEAQMRVPFEDDRIVLLSVENISISATPFRVISINDITERRKIQDRLIVTDRLASVGELAAGIAHELNNPLTGVIGFSELLMNREDIPEDIREDLSIVNKEALRASQVARHLLTFARKHPDEKQPVNVHEILLLVLELRAYEHKVNNISVITRFDPEVSEIFGNSFQLQQVFLNIIINAEYFMIEENGGGTLEISVEQRGDRVVVTFSDDGPGIPPESITRIFDPFVTTKDVGKGTGLGLSICYGIVTEHGGTIRAESVPGQGATFVVRLPVYEEKPEESD